MTDDLTSLMPARPQVAGRPLLGLTVLIVEDSRFASEAMRLLCLRSGARLRRADCLASARRHLAVYRPAVAVIDLGLPDGPGEDLIAELNRASPRISAILATSGDDGAEARACAAGADGFVAKPIASLADFQNLILSRLPYGQRRSPLRAQPDEDVQPDPIALRDDLMHASQVLNAAADAPTLSYLGQFLGGIARLSRDTSLAEAAARLGGADSTGLERIRRMIGERIAASATLYG